MEENGGATAAETEVAAKTDDATDAQGGATTASSATTANTAETVVKEEPEQEEKQPLSREEILAISRKENKNGDEREAQSMQRAMQLAFAVGLLVVGIIQIVNVLLNKEIPLELYMIYTAMVTTQGLYSGIKMAKRRFKVLMLACGGACGGAFIIFTVMWILQLCGVAL